MLKLELELSALDYEALIEKVLPLVGDKLENQSVGKLLGSGASTAMARAALGMMSQEKKDRMAAGLVNESADRIAAVIEQAAAQNGIPCRVRGVRASTED